MTQPRFNRVHAICQYLRKRPCERCPARFPTPYGLAAKGCYVLAKEVICIARHGYPWRPPLNARQRAWRSRWYRE